MKLRVDQVERISSSNAALSSGVSAFSHFSRKSSNFNPVSLSASVTSVGVGSFLNLGKFFQRFLIVHLPAVLLRAQHIFHRADDGICWCQRGFLQVHYLLLT